ncbi:MAG: sigma-54 dependent transcriptional regulator [Planctomycetaceae bacterium]|nr:sigma-54 dependent transcriptional regulator [Planctomycetaceae bacterium]
MGKVLVVDDKELMRDSVAAILSRKGHTVVTAPDGRGALARIADKRPECVVTDLQMPGMNGLELLEEIRKIDAELPVVFMTAFGSVETAVDAMRKGAFDYVTKPFSGDELAISVERALDHARLLRENQVLRAVATPQTRRAQSHRMIGSGAEMEALRAKLAPVAASHGTVLITGESGTGKEVAARFIHENSPRASGPFLAINCAALSSALLESELFGHEKGAFTGADRLRKGRFELADGGTLLLDEISEIPPDLQAKLLRVLQEKSFERVGSSVSQKADVRILATTNRDLSREVDTGRFRGDLFFRLNVLPIRMPALRERAGDISELAEHFLGLVADREGGKRKRLSKDALSLFEGYQWPGNVRELQNLCERAAVLANADAISADLVAPWLIASDGARNGSVIGGVGVKLARAAEVEIETFPVGVAAPAPSPTITVTSGDGTGLPSLVCDGALTLDEIERRSIVATLERNRGHRQKSAKALGIGVRTLGLKLKKWKEESLVPAEL